MFPPTVAMSDTIVEHERMSIKDDDFFTLPHKKSCTASGRIFDAGQSN
jgi:hypothetical protein